MRNKKPKPTLLFTGITAYVNWFKEINSHTFIISPEGNFYLVNGERIPAKDFENSMPMPKLLPNAYPKGDAIDGRSNWY